MTSVEGMQKALKFQEEAFRSCLSLHPDQEICLLQRQRVCLEVASVDTPREALKFLVEASQK